jgi:hypothetical protein
MTQKQKKAVSKVTAKRKTIPAMSKAAPPRTRARSVTRVLTENEVQQKAYSLWESRGRPFGSPEVDWYQAKEQLGPQKSS